MILSARRGHPLLTLTTDFGYTDHYTGTMKGAVLRECPDALIVDITHGLTPFSILEGAYTIAQAAPYFPGQTVHVVVVDPGVGTERRAVVVHCETSNQFFVAPDNGVLSMLFEAGQGRPRSVSIREIRAFDPQSLSQTFHGRDLFAPFAARLACGRLQFEEAGPAIDNLISLPPWQEQEIGPGTWSGTVLSVDRFGNLITSLRSETHRGLSAGSFTLRIGNATANIFAPTFGVAPENTLFAYYGSSGYVEVGLRQDSAAKLSLGRPGAPVTLEIALH